MKASILFKQYVWLVDTIRHCKRITLAELNERWLRTELSEGRPLSRTTFNRHRGEVEEIFGIIIGCDADNRYYIVSSDILHTDSVQQWMLNTVAVSNLVSEARGLHHRILLESIPSANDHLRLVVEAMQHSVRIGITYRRYGETSFAQWIIEPYCIKLFRRRWYLLGHFEHSGFITLSFDRIISIELTDKHFALNPNFDAEAFFAEYFGTMTDDRIPLQRIVLRAFGNERFALRDLPLHHSQKVVKEEGDHVDFELFLRPTSDFIAHILSRGRWVKIIYPESIAQQISNIHKESL